MRLANPLDHYSTDELKIMGKKYALRHALAEPEDIRAFELGAQLAKDPTKYERVSGLEEEELETLRKEYTNRWSQVSTSLSYDEDRVLTSL
jgi:hypothetical protein